ncbi:MAG TPA: hypothetical protein VHZ09_03825 [Acidobacteriaceae bacterium]|jgi:hypothetical protein|nr:hypothetical protein [Acidobacteriaceae bacterium]
MSTTAFLPALPPIGRSVRAYFAPVNRTQKQPTLFDPSQNGRFSVDAPPAPWIDLGWIENFARKSASKFGGLVTGSPGTTQFQVRETVEATVAFRFKSWTRLSMALAAGSQHMNLIAPAAGAAASGSGSKGVPAVSLTSGSTATFLAMAASDAAGFAAGSLVTVDIDYAGQTGFVGSGVSAAYVSSAAAVNSDPDYIRRVSFNVARVASSSSSGLQLAQPLLAGAPTAPLLVQPIVGFVDREGGSFFQEWSALFVIDGQQGERILFHYPRLQSMAGPAECATSLAPPLERLALSASFRALPVTDANDGEPVVCFRSFLPSAATLV